MSGRAADGLPRDDFQNLSDESLALHYKKYGRDGEVCLPSPAHDSTDSPRPRLYFRFKFKATMKQNVRYAVEEVLEKSSGTLFDTLSYTSCQCPGGAPPATCKHVATACHGLDEYTRTGVFRGCTSSTSASPAIQCHHIHAFDGILLQKFCHHDFYMGIALSGDAFLSFAV